MIGSNCLAAHKPSRSKNDTFEIRRSGRQCQEDSFEVLSIFYRNSFNIFQIDLFTVPDAILVGGNVTKITENA